MELFLQVPLIVVDKYQRARLYVIATIVKGKPLGETSSFHETREEAVVQSL